MKTILVTGGAKRIGRHIVEHFAAQGHQVIFQYFCSDKEATTLLKKYPNTEAIKADLRDPLAAKKIFQAVGRNYKKIDLLINNASVFIEKNLKELTLEEFDENFNLNLKAPIFLTQAYAKQYASGHVINIVDAEITAYRTDQLSYLLSKKMLAEFTQIAALSLAPKIRVNGIAPGRILPKQGSKSKPLAQVLAPIPLKRVGTLNDITDAIEALEKMTYVTGQILYVAGGKQLRE